MLLFPRTIACELALPTPFELDKHDVPLVDDARGVDELLEHFARRHDDALTAIQYASSHVSATTASSNHGALTDHLSPIFVACIFRLFSSAGVGACPG